MHRIKHTADTRTMIDALQWLEICIEKKTAQLVISVDMNNYTISIYSAPEADYVFSHCKENSFSSLTVVYKNDSRYENIP